MNSLTVCPGRMGNDKCERKAYPHKVSPDRNPIRLRVNKIGIYPDTCEIFLSDAAFFG